MEKFTRTSYICRTQVVADMQHILGAESVRCAGKKVQKTIYVAYYFYSVAHWCCSVNE